MLFWIYITLLILVLGLVIFLSIQLASKDKDQKMSASPKKLTMGSMLNSLIFTPINADAVRSLLRVPTNYTMNDQELKKALIPIAEGDIYLKLVTVNTVTGVQYPDWMSKINPETSFVQIAIPGTRESLTYGGCGDFITPWIQTQDSDIYYQLMDGIRYFDFRLTSHGDKVVPFHDKFKCTRNNYDEICSEINRFLDQYPSEIIVIRLEIWEGEDMIINKTIQHLGERIIKPTVRKSEYELHSVTPLASIESLRKYGNIMVISSSPSEYFFPRVYLWDPFIDEIMITPEETKNILYSTYTMTSPPENSLTCLMAYARFGFWEVFHNFYTLRKAAFDTNEIVKDLINKELLVPPINRRLKFNIIAVDFYQIQSMNEFIINLNFKQKNFKEDIKVAYQIRT